MGLGAVVPQGWRLELVGIGLADQRRAMTEVARTIENSGFDSLWVYDHFHTLPRPTQESTYEAWTLMAALATVTETVRLGQICTCNGHRNPAYLNFSGRLEAAFGLPPDEIPDDANFAGAKDV